MDGEEEEIEEGAAVANDTGIDDLPDETLEDIFSRLSTYTDLDSVKSVSRRWNSMAKKVIAKLKSVYEQSIITGNVDCQVISAVINEAGQQVPSGSWISERFGHTGCYYDKNLYVVGGTTHTPTTFNDMWKFDLSRHTWSRCLAAGQYPTPKALASAVQYKDNFVLFGGWSHPPPYPLMQPWRIFDELHIYNFPSNRWTHIITGFSPFPSAGHSASVVGDKMVVFGGRTFDQKEQSYPLSKSVWVFDFIVQEWFLLKINEGLGPAPRYGQTQITLDESHLIIIGGCGGPNQIFSDVWLLTISDNPVRRKCTGQWDRINLDNLQQSFTPNDFQYAGTKVGSSIVFFERSSPISPFLAFLHFDSQNALPPEQHGIVFEPSRSRYFHSSCSSGLRNSHPSATMSIYTLNISKILLDKTVSWLKEKNSLNLGRPNERLLYTMSSGRAELILFGGFYKDPNGHRCRVSNDVFILKPLHKTY